MELLNGVRACYGGDFTCEVRRVMVGTSHVKYVVLWWRLHM